MFSRYWWILFVMLPICALVGLLLSAVITYMQPKLYESEAVLEIRPYQCSDPKADNEVDRFFATEAAKIQSEKVLAPVITELDLTKVWDLDKQSALAVLRNSVQVHRIVGTDLVSLRVRLANKVDARDIAESITRSYRQLRDQGEQAHAQRMMDEMNKVLRDQEDRVEETRKIVSVIIRNKKINPDTAQDTISPNPGETQEEVIKRSLDIQDYLDAKREFETASEILKELKMKQIGESIRSKMPGASVEIYESPVISNLPVSPNVTGNLMRGITFGSLLSVPLSIVVMAFLSMRSNRSGPPATPPAESW